MAFVPGPQVAQVEIRALMLAAPMENTLYFKFLSVPDQDNLNALVAGVNSWLQSEYLPLLPGALQALEVYAADLSAPDGLQASDTVGLPAFGGVAQNALPANNSLAISFRTGLRGRTRRGRNYVMGLVEPQVTGNQVDTSPANAFIDAYSVMIGEGAVAADWTWGVFSRFSNGAPRTTGLFTPITDVVVTDRTVDSQRGRLR